MRKLSRFALLSISLLLALALAPPARAQTWPQRTVRIIVPLPPGAGTDLAARLFAERLSARWGQPVVVENRQGADGIPAVTGFVTAHDDHTLLLSFGGVITINPLVHDKLPYDPARDLVPISPVTNNFLAIAATGSLQVDTIDGIERAIRARPGPTIAEAGHPELTLDAIVGVYGWRDIRTELKERIGMPVGKSD